MSDRLRIVQSTGEEVLPLPRAVLLGDPQSAEFSAVLDELSTHIPEEGLTQVDDFLELAELYHQGEFPDLLVVVQTWSDQFPFHQFLELPGFGPLSRVICCYGPWCVSDGRSRQDWPLGLRVPVEHFGAALRREIPQLLAPQFAAAPIPWTAGRDEMFRSRQPVVAASLRCVVRIISTDRRLAEMWGELLRKAGFPIAAEGSAGGGQMVLWDVDPWTSEMRIRWNEFRKQHPNTKMVGLAGFATSDVISELHELGACAVLCKLLPLGGLLEEIQNAISPR